MNKDKDTFLPQTSQENEIIVYQPDEALKLDVRVENDTVWLTQAQMAELFQTTRNNVTLHIRNIFKEGELQEISVGKESLLTAADGKKYKTKLYNLDVIISVGYRVKSIRGTQFRQWANKILKEYLLRGYSVNQRLLNLEERMDRRFSMQDQQIGKLREDVDFFIKTSMPPRESVLYKGQIFDAYVAISDIIRSASRRIILIDNYIDDTVLMQLEKRNPGVDATIYTQSISRMMRQDIERHNQQYAPISVQTYTRAHDRFLIIDDTVYHIGASLKDLGKKLFAFSKMELITADEFLSNL